MQQLLGDGLVRNAGDELHYPLLHGSTGPVQLLNTAQREVGGLTGASGYRPSRVCSFTQASDRNTRSSLPAVAHSPKHPPVPGPSPSASLTSL